MRCQTLLIDFDGTLFDTRDAIRLSLAALAELHGQAPFAPDAVNAVIDAGLTLDDMLRQLMPELGDDRRASRAEDYRRIYNGGVGVRASRPYPELAATLDRIAAAGIEMILVSNKGEVSIRDALDHHGLDGYFRDLIGLAGKPDTAAFRRRIAPHMAATDAAAVMVVGDTPADLLYARAIGAHGCWARYGYGAEAACRALAPAATINRLNELPAVLMINDAGMATAAPGDGRP
ncbi:HAD family hydrolase (plasmid) [Tistrella mobilis]|uniref:HAD family hydrolase n=1 Tax=Tistrella mobilis TaxID=171437 RepID=UPI003558D576